MVKFRVKAFFMHEREKAAAAQAASDGAIADSEWTDGYVMGVVDEARIPELMQQGLVITPIEILECDGDAQASRSVRSVAQTARRQGAKMLGQSFTGKTVADKIQSDLDSPPQFYIVRINGPLTEARRGRLADIGVALLERMSSNKYTVTSTVNST